jgi:hypothetical protein
MTKKNDTKKQPLQSFKDLSQICFFENFGLCNSLNF